MKQFAQFPRNYKKNIQYVLTDIDDTLTFKGRLPAVVFAAMEQLQKAGASFVRIEELDGEDVVLLGQRPGEANEEGA